MLPLTIEYCVLEEFPSRAEGIRFLLGCSQAQLKKADLPKKWLTSANIKGEVWRLPVDLINHGKIAPAYTGPSTPILKESKNFLAVHKPAQLHSHPLRYSDTNTMLNALYDLGRSELLEINTSHYDRSLLYRLDFETSGVVIFAKSDLAYQEVRENFNSITKEKIYLAVVRGQFNREGFHAHEFVGSGVGGEKQKLVRPGEGQTATLEVSLSEYSSQDDVSLVRVKLKTGIRHQIRVQLATLGFPILGDELYGGEKSSRLFLHAYQYALEGMSESFTVTDERAELFDRFFDLNRTF
ncbi:MAG: pseudouridine synthase family protein [Bacteriovoracaceae bacterium]